MRFLEALRQKGKPKTPQEADALALKQLAARGADLTRARHLIHFLYFESERDARAAAELVEQAGWSVDVEEPTADVASWAIRADGTRVVSSSTIASFRAWFEQVAEDHRGEYDGWEASAKP